jgi:hypothetical protein
MSSEQLPRYARSEAVFDAQTPEAALTQAVNDFDLAPECLKAEEIEPGRYRVQVLKRDGMCRIAVDPDELRAILEYLTPPVGSGKALTARDLQEALKREGVSEGIDFQALKVAAEAAEGGGVITEVTFARAAPSKDGTAAEVEYKPPEIAALVRPNSPFRWLVQKGEVFGQKKPAVAPVTGRSVRGRDIPASGGEDNTPEMGAGIQVTPDGHMIAQCSGFLLMTRVEQGSRMRDLLQIEKPVTISADGLKAMMTLYPLRSSGVQYTPELLKNLLEEYGVVEGIRDADLPKICAFIKQRRRPVRRVLVAQGKKPKPGRNAEVNFQVPTKPTVGTILEDGRIDYRQRGFLQSLSEGETIATRTPPAEGTPGLTVEGKEIPTSPGKNVFLKPGPGAQVSEDGTTYTATCGGVILFLPDGGISIVKLFDHHGDVDYSTGNLEVSGSLVISGSVKPGFKVSADGDLLINGTLEAAEVKVTNSIAIGVGILGKNKCRVEAGNCISTRYAESAILITGGDIEIGEFLRHCEVYSSGHLEVVGRNGQMSGGVYVAQKGVRAKEVGLPAGGVTRVVMGVPQEEFRTMAQLRSKIEGILDETERPGTDPRAREKYFGLIEEHLQQLSDIERRLPGDYSGIRLEVQGRIHPGVEITIGTHYLVVDQEMQNVAFFFDPESRSIISEQMKV